MDDLLLELHKNLGLTIVMVSHEIESIKLLAGKILYLHDGAVLFDGTLADALATGPDRVKEFFARRVDPTDRPAPTTWEILQ